MDDLNQTDIVFDWRRILKSEEYRGSVGLPRQPDVIGPATLKNQVGVSFEPAVPALDIVDGFPKILVVGDGYVNGIHTAFAHLAKNPLRPIRILQTVDPVGGPCHLDHSG